MALHQTAGYSELLYPGLRKIFFLHLKQRPQEYSQFINVQNTDSYFEKGFEMAGLGAVPQKAEGDPTIMESIVKGSTKEVNFPEYGLGYVITRKMVDDDMYKQMKKLTQALRQSVRHTYEVVAWKTLNYAFTDSAAYRGMDAKPLCSTTHPINTGTIANTPAVATDLGDTAVENAVINFAYMKSKNGLPAYVRPKLAVIPATNMYKAAKIFKNAMKADTADNTNNWVRVGPDDNGIDSYLSSVYMTDTRAWFILADKSDHDLTLWVRISPEFEMADDFLTGNSMAKTYFRIESSFFEWRGVFGATGTA